MDKHDKTIPIPDHDFSDMAFPTMDIGSDNAIDSDLRRFAEEETRVPFPSKRRTIRFHMPQEVEPIVLMDVDTLIIGRQSGENYLDLSLQYGSMLGVSRNHAEITYVDGKYYLKDLNSTNGTYLNNQKLEPDESIGLENSDHLRLGHFVLIVNFS